MRTLIVTALLVILTLVACGSVDEESSPPEMTAAEHAAMQAGGGQGEVDTGVSTKVSGYLYRRLANSLKDLVVSNDNTVRTANKNIIQYIYGEDGVFPKNSKRGKSIDVESEIENAEGAK